MAKMGMIKKLRVPNIQSGAGTHDSRSVSLTVKDIPLGDIAMRDNIRREYTGIEELAESIRQYGLLQPITVYREGEEYIVKTGHRRFKAYQRLYGSEPDRFHSIRCVISNAENIAVIQLVENVQREDLSQIDLLDAFNAMKAQGMTVKQIAEIIGKSEGYVKNLFMGINEANNDDALKNLISHAGVTIQDIGETKGIPDKQGRLELLEKRGKGKISRAEMREKAKALKEGNPKTPNTPDTAGIIHGKDIPDRVSPLSHTVENRPEPIRIEVAIKSQSKAKRVIVSPVNTEDVQALISIEEDLRGFFASRRDKYSLVIG